MTVRLESGQATGLTRRDPSSVCLLRIALRQSILGNDNLKH
jgi:hypothetical protein